MTRQKEYASIRLFNGTGYALCGLIACIFALSYGLSYYQLDYWQNYFYKGALDAGGQCQVRTARLLADSWAEAPADGAATAWRDIRLPHPGMPLPSPTEGPGNWRRVTYVCRIGLPTPRPDMTYLHTGWVFGQKIRVAVNGDVRLDMAAHGAHKPVLPLRGEDFIAPGDAVVSIEALAKAGEQAGMIGAAPMVVAPSEMVHNRLLSLEVSLQTVRYLYTLIPILVLGLILCYGWARGIRSRMMLVTLHFFTLAALKNVLFVFADLWPWSLPLTYLAAEPFTVATGLVLWLLIAEGFGLWGSSILVPMLATSALLAITLAAMAMSHDVYAFTGPLNLARVLTLAVGGWVGWQAFRRKLSHASNQDWSRSYFYVLTALAVTFWGVTAADFGFYLTAIPIRMGYKFEYILPLAVGYALIQNLLQINRKYERERKAREKIEGDLETAREIQDSIAPPEVSTLSDRFELHCYQVKHEMVAGDWMAVRTTSQGIIGIVADATGKGVQAALVIHALQSLWAAELDHDDFDVGLWLAKANRTLLTLGKKRPHSMTLGVFVLTDARLTYWSAGHLPLYVAVEDGGQRQLSALNARGNIIGIVEELSLKPEVMPLAKSGKVSLLLGTDGVFDKGTRAGRRAILKLFDALERDGEAALRDIPTADDRTVILLKERVA